ncbi:MAG: N-acetylglucosamine-6-phosphate deacetylase [Lachnospiraceae bacterium]|nr:N-acetylglucosamine-6-phosphate deacetylase [Lachnospiraceae bacterium]
MIIKNAYVFTTEQGFVKKDTVIENGYFSDRGRLPGERETVIDAQENYLIPGLVDVHFHGCGGYDFSDGTPEAMEAIGDYELRSGITAICPAAMTLSEEMLRGICENAYAYSSGNQAGAGGRQKARLCGIHLEGPFISAEKKGAQNPAYIASPDIGMFRRLQEAARGLVRLITIAPEMAGAMDFISELHEQVHISLGHTMSDYDVAFEAFGLGADHVTHCFNAMPGFSHRAPGVIGAAADASHVMPELICDGVHVHPSAVRAAFKLFGGERMILISDSMRATGMADGAYTLGGLDVDVKGNRATLADGTLAGSVTNLMDCMRTAVSMGIPLETAVRCATYNPAKSIGVEALHGRIADGAYGDCVLLSRADLSVQEVILGGEIVKK